MDLGAVLSLRCCVGSSLAAVSTGCSLAVVLGLLSLRSPGSAMCGLQQVWPVQLMGLFAPRQVESSWTRD